MNFSFSKKTLFLLPLILSIFVFFVRFSMLQKSSEPTGLDGYYYALQAKSFAENGVLENPDYKLGYYLCGFTTKICGDAILGCKIYSALSNTLISLGIFAVIFACTNSMFFSLLGFFISASSFCVTSISINFINNQTGIAFFLFAFAFFFSFRKIIFTEKKIKKILFAFFSFGFLILSVLSHKILAVYSIYFLILFSSLFLRKISSIFENKKLCISISVFLGIVLCVLVIFGGKFLLVQLPRFFSSFSFPSLPLFHSSIINRFGKNASIEMTIIFLLTWIFSFEKIIFILKNRKIYNALLTLVFALLLFFPFWNFDSQNDIGVRLFLSSIPFGIVFILIEISKILHNFQFSEKIENYFTKKTSIVIFSILAILIFYKTISNSTSVYNPKNDPPYKYYRTIIEDINLPDDSLLIAHLGLNHTYTYYKNLRWSLNYIPDFNVNGGVWRLAYGANVNRIEEILSENKIHIESEEFENAMTQIDRKYLLIREDLWQKYLQFEDSQIAESFQNWYNPHTIRPRFIRQKLQ